MKLPVDRNTELNEEAVSLLFGKAVRVYNKGDMLTQDFIPERVNIELSAEKKILRVWLG